MTGASGPAAADRRIVVAGPRSVSCLPADPPAGAPGPDEVDGRTLASLVSPGTELNWYWDPEDPGSTSYPVVPGYASVLEIERVGPGVTGLAPGDRVLDPSGRHAGRQRVPARRLVRLPAGLDPATATVARLMAVSMATLSTTSARPPEAVGVSGLGLVGHLAARILAASGYEVTAWDVDPRRRALLDGTGIALADRAPVPAGRALDDGEVQGPLALVAECSGNDRAVVEACAAVRRGGEVVVVGVPWRAAHGVLAQELLRVVFQRYVVLRSGWEYQVADEPADFRGGSTRANLAAALRWLADGRIDVRGLVAPADPAAAPAVYAALHDRSWPALSAVFRWDAP